MAKLIVPGPVGREVDLERSVGETTCPAAHLGRYSDSHRMYVRCGVTGQAFTVSENPVAARAFCCGDYGDCPIWQAEKGEGVDLDDWRGRVDERRNERLTHRQIEHGHPRRRPRP